MKINFLPANKNNYHHLNTFILLMALFLLLGFSITTVMYAQEKNSSPVSQVCFKEFCFDVRLAVSEKERARGLMYQKKLPANKGMLFIFNTADRYGFWMKNTLIPLDIIWLDKNYKVVDISSNTPPCEIKNCPIIKPKRDAMYVLEINGGLAQWMGITDGDSLQLKKEHAY